MNNSIVLAKPNTAESNFFSVLGMTISCDIDLSQLRKHYFSAQRNVHPDCAKNDEERLLFIQHSADINDAYHTLKDDNKRLFYVLHLHGYDVEHAKNTPPALLMEMMELREAYDDARSVEERTIFAEELAINIINTRKQCAKQINDKSLDQAVVTAHKLRYLVSMYQDIQPQAGQ